MSNKFVTDSFENLGGGTKAVAGQVKQVFKGIGDDVAESIGLKPVDLAGTGEQGGQQKSQKAQDDQMKQKEAQSKNLARKRYREIQEEIRQIQAKRSQEMVKYNQPGFTEEQKQENQIKQLEEKPSFAKATAGGKDLPPLPAKKAQRQTEMHRGVSG